MRCESWAIALKDALDQALMFTAAWMNVSDTATASVHTDFAADLSNVEQAKVLSDGSAKGIVSKKTVRGEWKRTGVLGPDYDKSDEEQRLAEEQQGLDPEDPINPINGDVVSLEERDRPPRVAGSADIGRVEGFGPPDKFIGRSAFA